MPNNIHKKTIHIDKDNFTKLDAFFNIMQTEPSAEFTEEDFAYCEEVLYWFRCYDNEVEAYKFYIEINDEGNERLNEVIVGTVKA